MQSTLYHSRSRVLWRVLFTALACLFALAGPARAELAIHVRGNQLVNGEGRPIRLLGVNFSGAEYECIQDRGIWSAPTDQQAIEAMAKWHIDVVRIPLNEDCWLGINGAPAEYSGTTYQHAIHEFVQALHSAGIYAILDLQWSAPGTEQATGLQQMADADHSVEFWSSVAESFREDPAVLFDLYSEPHEISWECWLEGCALPAEGGDWQTAGMQALVDAVRAQGATQPLLLGGVEWANDLSEWLAHVPVDPRDQLVASVHVYPNNTCATESCWSATLAPIAARYPLVAGEIGEFDCADHFIDQFMNWSDANGVSYLGWTWNTFDCSKGPALIASPDGTPTTFGAGLHDRLRTPKLTFEASPEPAVQGQVVTLTARVRSPTLATTPTGSVTFEVDGGSLSTRPLDVNGQAQLTLPELSVGAHTLRAVYSGEEALEPDTSETQTVDVSAREIEPPPASPPIRSPSTPHSSPPASPPVLPPPSVTLPAIAPPAPSSAPTSAAPAKRVKHRKRTARHKSTPSRNNVALTRSCSRTSRARARGARERRLRALCESPKSSASPSRNAAVTRPPPAGDRKT